MVSIAVGIAGIAGFVLTMIDRHNTSRRSRPRPDSAEPSAATADAPGAAVDSMRRRRSGVRRLLLSPLVFLAAFLGAGLLAVVFDDTNDEVDLSAIVGWSVATSVTLAWVYFAAQRLRRT